VIIGPSSSVPGSLAGARSEEKSPPLTPDRYLIRPFDQYVNGDWFPNASARAVKIRFIIDRRDDWLVFLGEDGTVCFECSRSAVTPKDLRRIINRAVELQSYDLSDIRTDQQASYRWLIGAGIAAALSDDPKAADSALDSAREYIDARSREIARYWYIVASSQAAGIAVCGLLIMLLVRFLPSIGIWRPAPEESGWSAFVDIVAAALAGGAGALLSILSRINSTPLDARAGRWMHQLDGFIRVGIGCLGALFVILACRLNLLSGVVQMPSNPSFMGTLFLGMLAGVSERLVPSLIRKVDIDDGTPKPALPAAPASSAVR
jgi:hypothetical protein